MRDDMDDHIAESIERLGEKKHGMFVSISLAHLCRVGRERDVCKLCNVPDRKLKKLSPGCG